MIRLVLDPDKWGEQMKATSEDRRIQKTRRALREALVSIMFEKSYDSILTQELLDRANVGRSTFYTHFRDKDELLIDGLLELKQFLFDAKKVASHASGKTHERVIGFSQALFDHAYSHKKLYRALIGGAGWTIVRQQLEGMLVDLMKDEVRNLFNKRSASDVPVKLFVHFLGSNFMSVMTWWLNHADPVPPAEINAMFRELILPTLEANLRSR